MSDRPLGQGIGGQCWDIYCMVPTLVSALCLWLVNFCLDCLKLMILHCSFLFPFAGNILFFWMIHALLDPTLLLYLTALSSQSPYHPSIHQCVTLNLLFTATFIASNLLYWNHKQSRRPWTYIPRRELFLCLWSVAIKVGWVWNTCSFFLKHSLVCISIVILS